MCVHVKAKILDKAAAEMGEGSVLPTEVGQAASEHQKQETSYC